jgi:hypothetical protein
MIALHTKREHGLSPTFPLQIYIIPKNFNISNNATGVAQTEIIASKLQRISITVWSESLL